MDINATIIGQFITFSILIWFTMKFVWPQIIKTIHEREKKIAAGLEAAERAKRELEVAEHKANGIIREAKQHASQIIEQANLHSAQLIEEAKKNARQEGDRIVAMAQGDIERNVTQAKQALKNQLVTLAVAGAERLIKRNLDASKQGELLDELVAEM